MQRGPTGAEDLGHLSHRRAQGNLDLVTVAVAVHACTELVVGSVPFPLHSAWSAQARLVAKFVASLYVSEYLARTGSGTVSNAASGLETPPRVSNAILGPAADAY